MRKTRNTLVAGATAAVTVLMLASVAGCGKTESSESLVADARQFIQAGDTKSAVIQLKNAVLKNPANVEARLTLGALYNDMGDAVSAEKEIRKAAELGATPEKTVVGLAIALMGQGKFQKVLDETAASSAGKADVLALRGDAHFSLGNADAARLAYEQALQVNPKQGAALLGMARRALSLGDDAGARRLADQATSGNPNDPTVWMFKGALLRAEGKNDEALAMFDQALKVKPDHRSASIEKAYIKIAAKQFDAAQADMAAANKAAPNSLMVLYAQALLDHAQGKHAAAKESLQKVLRVAPEHMPSVLLAGSVESALGSLPQAELHLKKYVANVPRNANARKMLVATLMKLGKITEAQAALEPLMADANKDPQVLALAGELAMQSRDFAKAGEFLERAARMAPEAAVLRTSLAVSKLAQGDDTRAIAELEESVRLDGKSTRAGKLLVLAEMRAMRFDKALAAADAMAKQQPNDPAVRNLMGGVYLAKGDLANARTSFEKAIALEAGYFPAVANLAQLEMKENKPELAKKHLVSFLEKNKKSVYAMSGLAELAQIQGKPAEVTQWREKALAENPDGVAPAMLLSAHYLRTGANQKALSLVRKFQVAHPKNPEVLDMLGQAQLASGDREGALESYSKLTGLVPKSAPAQFRLASVHMALDNPAAAAANLKKALAIDPNYHEAQLAHAELKLRGGKPDEALAMARAIQKQRPKEPAGFMLEGGILQAQGKDALAVRSYEQALALANVTVIKAKLHSALIRSGKGKEADVRMAEWQKQSPGDLQLNMYAADTLLAKKQYKDAIAQMEQLVAKAPNNPLLLNNLAWAYQQENDPRALKTAEKALANAPDNPAVLDTVGTILVQRGDVKRGLGYLTTAAAKSPADADIRLHLAQALAKSGDKAGARKALEQAMKTQGFEKMDEARALQQSL
ncbi:PEP-CTERM system TPR-repeat protein PrsT [Massilia sp. RP-1-19]|uniref:PEP-CTERM system TPR-repeat protein PrsT n=1 Tax=Massilia polaris TaxID=2728846 RepID=A0A848HGL2_9BURK|nr:XrtA/PEP-CTERM system TPR-repeat protein PrsT [Massilia polaris]NML60364.1 PEP-CTERM system TPR-repeat protein PrsT [Massilia polaris]